MDLQEIKVQIFQALVSVSFETKNKAKKNVIELIAEVERLQTLARVWKQAAKKQRAKVGRMVYEMADTRAMVAIDNQMRWKPILQREEDYQAQQRAEIERLQAENEQLKNELERAKEACNFLCDWEEKALEADAIGDNHPLYKSIQIQAGIAGAKAVSIASQITGRMKKDEISNQ